MSTSVDPVLRDSSVEVYTDGSKSVDGVGGGVFIPEYRKSISFRLPDHCSILQAEISAIKRAVNWLMYGQSGCD